MVPVVDVDHALPAAFAMEAHALSASPSISVPVSKELGSAIGRGLETPPTVSDHAMLLIVLDNYWSFSIRLWHPML